MKQLFLKINKCRDCPYCKLYYDNILDNYEYCEFTLGQPEIKNSNIIPEWCPLEDCK